MNLTLSTEKQIFGSIIDCACKDTHVLHYAQIFGTMYAESASLTKRPSSNETKRASAAWWIGAVMKLKNFLPYFKAVSHE